MENRCVVCGAMIPEGRQICPNCEKGYMTVPDDKEQEECALFSLGGKIGHEMVGRTEKKVEKDHDKNGC